MTQVKPPPDQVVPDAHQRARQNGMVQLTLKWYAGRDGSAVWWIFSRAGGQRNKFRPCRPATPEEVLEIAGVVFRCASAKKESSR